MGVQFWAVGVCKTRHCPIVIEPDPLGRAGEPVAAWDAEVGNATIVEDVALRGPLKGFFVLENSIFESLDSLGEAMELHSGIGFAVGDGGEKSVRNGAKEYHVDVVVHGED